MAECSCDARRERDLLSTRLGELAMTEMENEALRGQVDDLSRAVQELQRQADEQRHGMLLEMEVLKRRASMAHDPPSATHYYSDDDDDDDDRPVYHDDEPYMAEPHSLLDHNSMQHLWLGDTAVCAPQTALLASAH